MVSTAACTCDTSVSFGEASGCLVRSEVAWPVWQFGEVMVSHYAKATPTQQKVILEAMRADWQRHRDRVLAKGGEWWAERYLRQMNLNIASPFVSGSI